ncbi:hypothetical protein B0H15DRAFT_972793 [Mycena belliarum]|uniref:P-loop containing nucleoside triphosphate hydrolase protein n=1 Tax=Mycena belliarum TaxID=1033014 RepID=A0AAD6UCJ2_9AGAR|nr:hypothetical protein B0H15DRAFT_972793 [Mycena belliae]
MDFVRHLWTVVVGVARLEPPTPRDWSHTLVVPLYVATLSAGLFLVQHFFRPASDVPQESWKKIEKYGGPVVLSYNVLRLLACWALLGLSVTSSVILRDGDDQVLHLGACIFYLYTSFLAALSVSPTTKTGATARLHLDVVLAAAFCVFFYRDVVPLATYTWPVQDAAEGPLLSAKLVALALAAVVIPLLTPQAYVPVDPANPMPKPNAEQVASPLSLLLFSFLDPVVAMAYRLPHLPLELLPPLADTDDSGNLKKRSFPNIDVFSGASRHHIFLGLLKTFRTEYAAILAFLLVYVAGTFASPIGINRLLAYLEGDGESSVRPFVWILWLALGPLTGTAAMQGYYRLSMRALVQIEGLLTELIFEHALRVRVKADKPRTHSAPPDVPPGSGDAASDASSDTARGTPSTTSKDAAKPRSSSSSSSADVGMISNLVTTDLRNVTNMSDFLILLVFVPVSIVFCIVFLYVVLGWSAFVGMGTMVLLFPISAVAARMLQDIQKGRIKAADARIGTISESGSFLNPCFAMNVLRMVKLFGWEENMLMRVNEKREAELHWIWKREIFEWVANTVNNVIPIVTMLTVIMKQELRPSIVFSTVPVFNTLRMQLNMANYRLIQFIDAKVSLDRINNFLHNTELLDSFTEAEPPLIDMEASTDIGFCDAYFTWSNDTDGSATPSPDRFALRIDDELLFKRGCINLVLGPTGAGKTSLLMALLGEMHFTPSRPGSWYNLPRGGGVAYAAQESWVLNETIRDNILFGSEYDEERYKKVLHQCALERDLELFEAGDLSEVGEKGLTLSGGQKARCTLARAIYSKAEILLLDDVLAALDVHTSKWIVENCFGGDLVRGRTIILVTHNVALVAPIADFTVSIGLNGRILSQGSVAEALERDIVLANEANVDLQVMEQVADAEPVEPKKDTKTDGKLILAEEVKLGKVKWSAVNLYLRGLGGLGFYTIFIGGYFMSYTSQILATWYLGYFAAQYQTSPPGSVPAPYYLGMYSLIVLFDITIRSTALIAFAFACLRASRVIHQQLIEAILGTTLRWLDVTPASRVIARFTADITAVDGPILNVFGSFTGTTIALLTSFGAVVFLTPLFSVPGILAAVIGGAVGQVFVKAQLSVKRESSNAKAPVLGHFGAAIAGLSSIRAYGAQGPFIEESLRRINTYTRTARTLSNLDRWVGVRLPAVGNILAAVLATYLVYVQKEHASNVGFSLTVACMDIFFIASQMMHSDDSSSHLQRPDPELGSRLEQRASPSLERIQQYIDIEQEKKPTETGRPPAHWPSSGELVVEKLSARYAPGGPKVLRDISFRVKSGERVGIVGRTGSGKSSLTLALLRCLYTEGTVYFDGISTASINLDALRSNITIIPQMPELLSGTLRHNLDPFEQYDDVTLNSALRSAGLFSLQQDMDDGRLGLDSVISSGGGNLSVGQRQILALARAIVRDSKLLILDEGIAVQLIIETCMGTDNSAATSAIDYRTDSVIQASLRNELKSDVTILTVAHRLQTILDSDKIMVLDEGRIVEFDAPKVLLKNPKGKLRALVDESGDKESLYAMAEGKAQSR